MNQKRIVVTGGAGFLGSHVVRLLLQENNIVNVLDNFSNGKIEHLEPVRNHPNLNIIRGDIKNIRDVKDAFKDCQIIIHLAVLCLRQSIKDPQLINDVIVNGTMNCLDTALSNKVELFINCSSSEAYGTAVYIPMDENHPLNPETPYAAAKVAQDMYVFSYGRTYELPWTTIRPFNMYGPNSHWQGLRGELIPKMIVRAMNRKPLVVFGDGQQTRDFIYVEEAARAVLAVADNLKCKGQSINFCTGVETSIFRIAQLICKSFLLDPREYIDFQPTRPGDVKRHIGDNSRFRSLLGFAPNIGIEEGLGRTISWFRSLPYKAEDMLSGEVIRAWE
jgi:UDP-glucose 4-epimerase